MSEILKVVQLNGAIFFNAHFTAPWCVQSPAATSLAQTLGVGEERVLLYHYMVDGSCLVTMEDMAPVRLHAGDIVVFPHGDAHTMASSTDVQPLPMDAQAVLRERPKVLHFGGGGESTRFICGYMVCDPRLFHTVLAALSRVVTVSLLGLDQGRWLQASVQHAVEEASAPRPGTEGLLAKLSEVMVVEALRLYVAQLSPEHTGWLAGLRDRVVGKCLALMHEKPAHAWTVDSLAREVGASRSVLAERFTHFVGQSPMQYLGRWRMALATNHLRRSSLSVARIAEEVGYETDAAFSRAFRREFGVPPATWRRMQGGRP
ncbi:AraC family transcriptional regulator [Variovorax sp. J22R133]|uniref:AraC family transcriptional regulator n=1 Tax=Variovorax brevis TaxID=3053503 RepID=UPI0025780BC5|nr:AraC family transcriptional regulator [Variovorax sp. J22R133]MDM0114766.1 AraC family transcriptional regulator [Variovorax sp. J22R133]